MGSLNILKGTINAKQYIEGVEQHILHPDNVSVRKGLEYCSKTMLNHILHPSQQLHRRRAQGKLTACRPDLPPYTASITTAWLHRRRVWGEPAACSPHFSLIEKFGAL
ncbi:hypothetical protein GDO78_018499 [Eleutherodactylus coqui]|uniref:Uncharacterized protein n=1 Tax=Eleutherodactylus coqui TaxID=57060 RepID=A0A8J6B762_ELECQ|nr:hypothetical protein GDO78_018499 [Eleutherodactylus coqui]